MADEPPRRLRRSRRWSRHIVQRVRQDLRLAALRSGTAAGPH